MEVRIYTNGLYDYKSNIGGWGTVLVYGSKTKELYGTVNNSTQNIACLTGLLEGLRSLKKENLSLRILCFSTSVISPLQNMNRLLKRLQREEDANLSLWKEIVPLLEKHSFTAEWLTKDSLEAFSIKSITLAKNYKNGNK